VGFLARFSMKRQSLKTLLPYFAALTLSSCATAEFHPYQGTQQAWPTAPGAFVDNRYTIPTYYGYPPRPYLVVGSVNSHTLRPNRFAVLSYAANRAKAMGADAIIAEPRDADADTPNPYQGGAFDSAEKPRFAENRLA
jgi:hypothetical protein